MYALVTLMVIFMMGTVEACGAQRSRPYTDNDKHIACLIKCEHHTDLQYCVNRCYFEDGRYPNKI